MSIKPRNPMSVFMGTDEPNRKLRRDKRYRRGGFAETTQLKADRLNFERRRNARS